jgi:hypothetical protein
VASVTIGAQGNTSQVVESGGQGVREDGPDLRVLAIALAVLFAATLAYALVSR